MVFLERAGRPDVIAGGDPEAASGLAQILASTAVELLGMEVDLEASRSLTERIAGLYALEPRLERRARRLARRARGAGRREAARLRRRVAAELRELRSLPAQRRRLERERARVDDRFDPRLAIEGMARYLEIARRRFGREDLAIASYPMGIGNLEDVIRRYVRPGDASGPIAEVVEREGITYAALFFDSSPLRNPRTHALLSSLGDDSSTYLWRVLASRDAMATYREDRDALRELAELHTAKATAEEVFHPHSETEVYDDPGELERAWRRGEVVAIPDTEDFRVGRQLGELADDLALDRDLYRGLQPTALGTLAYLASRVRAITGDDDRLVVTSAVRDRRYQDALVGLNPEATREYSLHTTGWSFDIWRRYRSDAQAQAFQFVLDRLRAMAVLDYAVEPQAIHVTVSPAAEPLLDD
jgi:hypothetical protein